MGEVRPQMDEYWIARIKFWPTDDAHIDVVTIYYVWEDGVVDFLPCAQGYGGDPVRSTQCAHFELLERVEVEKYK